MAVWFERPQRVDSAAAPVNFAAVSLEVDSTAAVSLVDFTAAAVDGDSNPSRRAV